MKKKMSTCEKFFREEGTENTIRNFIERKRSRHVPEEQIHEELLLDFGLDAAKALQYRTFFGRSEIVVERLGKTTARILVFCQTNESGF